MIFRLFRRTPRDPSIALLYGAIVAQARAGVFYQNYHVPDTVSGRFEMIVLHLVLLLRRLGLEGEQGRALGQDVFDHFCRDMDANLREMGVGDLSVPREMRGLGEAFYGRQQAYAAALAGADRAALPQALARNVYGVDIQDETGAERLAAYVGAVVRALAAQGGAGFRCGQLQFPDPAQALGDDQVATNCCKDKNDEARSQP
jgi:cytochrome b pre-mRNA-processing protein 3